MGTKMEVMERTMKRMEVRRKEEEEEEGEKGRGIYSQLAGADAVPNQEVTSDRSQRGRRDGLDAIVLRDNVLFDSPSKNGSVAETRGYGLCCTSYSLDCKTAATMGISLIINKHISSVQAHNCQFLRLCLENKHLIRVRAVAVSPLHEH